MAHPKFDILIPAVVVASVALGIAVVSAGLRLRLAFDRQRRPLYGDFAGGRRERCSTAAPRAEERRDEVGSAAGADGDPQNPKTPLFILLQYE